MPTSPAKSIKFGVETAYGSTTKKDKMYSKFVESVKKRPDVVGFAVVFDDGMQNIDGEPLKVTLKGYKGEGEPIDNVI